MAVEVASLKAVLDLDKKGLDTGLKSASQGLNSFGASIGGAMAALGAVGAAVGIFSGVTSAIGGMVAAAREAIAVEKELTQVILASNGVAGVSVQMAKDYANSLSLVTNFTDDAILATESMLLTYTNISKDVFPAALEAGLDLAQFFKMEGPAAAKLWGKALNDPAKGMTALTRMGVTFTDQQKAMVKSMMAVNDTAGAQRVMIEAVASQGIGGQARAMADPFIQVSNALGEIQEMLGMGLMPMLLEVAKAVLPALQEAAASAGPALGEFGIALGKAFGNNLVNIIEMVVDLAGHFGTFITGISELGVALGIGGEQAKGFNILLLPLKITFTILGAALHILGATFSAFAGIIRVVTTGYGLLFSAVDRAIGISAAVMPVWNALSAAGTTLSQIIQIIALAWQNLIAVMSAPFMPPPLLTPGSPTPLELGLRGINSAIRAMPTLNLGGVAGGGMVPMAAGGGNVSHTTVINMGGQSMTFSGPNGKDDALLAMIQFLRQQLDK